MQDYTDIFMENQMIKYIMLYFMIVSIIVILFINIKIAYNCDGTLVRGLFSLVCLER